MYDSWATIVLHLPKLINISKIPFKWCKDCSKFWACRKVSASTYANLAFRKFSYNNPKALDLCKILHTFEDTLDNFISDQIAHRHDDEHLDITKLESEQVCQSKKKCDCKGKHIHYHPYYRFFWVRACTHMIDSNVALIAVWGRRHKILNKSEWITFPRVFESHPHHRHFPRLRNRTQALINAFIL